MNHFEELWESAEKLLQADTESSTYEEIIAKIQSSLSIYQSLSKNTTMSDQDRFRLKVNLMGKILLTISQISMKDNVNVYRALELARDEVQISMLEEQYR